MKYISIVLLVLAMILAGCQEPVADIDDGEGQRDTATAQDYSALAGYLDAFGHVRVLGDVDHILKGEKVDDEEGVTVQSMVAGTIAVAEDGKTVTIPLTLTKYDFDGHRNADDPTPWLYTRIATGTVTLELSGTTKDGVFTAETYAFTDVDVTLDIGEVDGYAKLPLSETTVKADEITGAFVDADGYKLTPVVITIADGKPVAITDVENPKFGHALGSVEINGKEGNISLV